MSVERHFITSGDGGTTVRDRCISYLLELPKDTKWSIMIREHRKKRTLAQNSLMWVWLGEISRKIHERGGDVFGTEQWHAMLRDKFLGWKAIDLPGGGTVNVLRSTTELNTKEFTQYLEDIEHYVGSEYDISLMHPEVIYYEAMGHY